MNNTLITIKTEINSVQSVSTDDQSANHLQLDLKSAKFNSLLKLLKLNSDYNREDNLLAKKRLFTDIKNRYSKCYSKDTLYLLKQYQQYQIWGKLIINSDFKSDLGSQLVIAVSYADAQDFHLIDLFQANISDLKPVIDKQKKIYDELVDCFTHAKYLNLKSDLDKYLIKPESNVMHETTDFNYRYFNKIAIILQAMYGDAIAGRYWTELHDFSELISGELMLNLIKEEC